MKKNLHSLFFLYELIYSVVEVLETVAVAMVSVADAVLDMILQDYLGGIIERRAHRRKLDEHIGAVPSLLDHALHRLEVPDGAGKPVHDGLSLRVRMPVTVLMSVGMGVDVTVAMVMIVQLPGIMLLGESVYILVCHSLSSFIKDTPKACPQSVKEHNVKLSRNGIIYATVEKTDKKAEKVRTIPAPCC